MAVAETVLGLEDRDVRRMSADALASDDAKRVELRQRLLLLGRDRRKRVAKRPRLDTDHFRVGIIDAHFAERAHDFACRTIEIDELLVLATVIVQVRQSRRLDARAL